ncbi:hypothetical protein [Qipengyuania marisflavi]|uniref:Uncharacterized protein n=1 Tax=Qipengyuania marisflavi TaxID=2486356 RepID=A0A5S3Q0V7_9SPHN|nr:hypothetical protein [Qipengyuania marisflavi]TMM49977.1 hypothetical protein FEV51_01910 [Qipengyuania marisflavi]
MRIALISTHDTGENAGALRPAYMRFGGARIVERQLDLALATGCKTIACLASTVGREVIELQHRSENAGAKFVALRDPLALAGLVTAADDLMVIAPGLLPDEAVVLRHAGKPAVLAFHADAAVPLGYERIDADLAWAGVLFVRGAAVERLAELPPDSDIPSALLRIALQSGVRPVVLDHSLLDEGAWHLNATQAQLEEREARWIRSHSELAPFTAPGLAVSERMGARIAHDVLGKPSARVPWIGAAVAGIVALGLAILEMPAIGLGFAALGTIFASMGEVIERIGQGGKADGQRTMLARVVDGLLDPILVILIALASPEAEGWLRLFVPAVLFGLLHLGRRWARARWRRTYADRVTLAIMLAPAAFFGLVQPVAAVLALAVLISLFFAPPASE